MNKNDWIKSSDKLPEISDAMNIKRVLIIFQKRIAFGWRFTSGWRMEGSPTVWQNDQIKFWQPLPDLPDEILGSADG